MSANSSNRTNQTPALAVLTSLFFIWGFITCLNDILIPHLKAVFTLNYTQAMLVQFCFFAAYFVMSLPSGYLVEKLGYRRGIVVGLAVAGSGCLLFYPAAGMHSYPLFLGAFFVLASGITLLQVAANPYVTVLGSPETASSRLTLTQAFNSLGTTLAPFFGAALLMAITVKSDEQLQGLDAAELAAYQAAQAASVQLPYLGLAGVLFLLAGVFGVLRLPAIAANAETSAGEASVRANAWAYPHLRWGAVAIFLYVGAEVAIGSFMVNFLGQTQIAGLSEAQAGRFLAFYWGGAMAGRFVGAAVMRHFHPARVLACHAAMAVVLVVSAATASGQPAMWSLIAVGLCNSVMFPTLFSLALTGLAEHTGQGSGILCAAIVGGAIVPLLKGALADAFGIQTALVLPALCYCYIAGYAVYCRRLSPQNAS